MKQTNQKLLKVLEARENRAVLRNEISKKGFDSLSLSFNIPGYPKSNELLTDFFSDVLNDLKIFLQSNRISITNKQKFTQTDDAGNFFIMALLSDKGLKNIKKLTEAFEENHALGRLIDVDVFGKDGIPISSGKEKSCYFCGEYSAVSCMRNKRHSYPEIRTKIFKDITNYLKEKGKEKQIQKICSHAQRALLYEISISNKPGLVCFENQGVHKDMHYFTFLDSTSVIMPFFREFCELGFKYKGGLETVLPKIREIGLRAEKEMFSATNSVNTHKGIVFLFGISLFTISKILSKNKPFSHEAFQNTIKKIGKDLVANELDHLTEPKTHGEIVYTKYGKEGAGIRLEVENGFPTIFTTAIPFLKNNLKQEIYSNQLQLQEVLLQALLHIISVNNDTNILFRSSLNTLNHIKHLAKMALKDPKTYPLLVDFCKKERLSPGGSADLLAVSLLLHFIKTDFNEF